MISQEHEKKFPSSKLEPPRPQTPPEVASKIQEMVEGEKRKEITAELAKLCAIDEASYTTLLNETRETYGPVLADAFHKDVMKRMKRFEQASPEAKAEKLAAGLDVPAPEMAQRIVDFLAPSEQAARAREESEAQASAPEAAGRVGRLRPYKGDIDEQMEQQIVDDNAARAQQTAAILNDLGPKIGVPPDKVPIKANEEARQITEAHGASGLMVAKDATVYMHPDEFNPSQKEGQKLLAEEIAHWAQMHNALTGAGAELSPRPAAEGEGKQIAEDYAAGRTPARPQETIEQGAVLGDTGLAGPPSKVILNIGGVAVETAIPATTQNRVTVEPPASPIPNMTLGPITLEFDSEWKVQGGSTKANIIIGNFVNVSNADIEVLPGGATKCAVEGAGLKISDFATGSIDLNIDEEGIRGNATVTFEQINIGLGIVPTEGFIRVGLSEQGKVSAVGSVSGDLPGVGTFTLKAAIEDQVIGGTANVVVENPIPLGGGVLLEEAVLSGNYMRQMFRLNGEASVKVGESFAGRIQGSYEHPAMMWSANGTVAQIQPIQMGEMTLSEGMIGLIVENGSPVEVTAGGKFTLPQFEGSVGGSYDIQTNRFTQAEAQAKLIEEVPLGDSDILLENTEGAAKIQDNELVEIIANAAIKLPFEGEPTFRVEAQECLYRVKEGTAQAGSAKVSTLRELSFGEEDANKGVAIPVYLAYRAFIKGDLDFDRLKQSVLDFWSLLQGGYEWIKDYLPDWFKEVLAWVQSADPMSVLRDSSDWLTQNLRTLGQEAIDFLNDAGEWGPRIIAAAGRWAMEAAGWSMDALSELGEEVGDLAEASWETISSLF